MKSNKTDTLRRVRRLQLNVNEIDSALLSASLKYPFVSQTLRLKKQELKLEISELKEFAQKMNWSDHQ